MGPESNQASERESRRKRQLQNSARLALAQCSSVARRQVSLERQERNCNSRLHKLLGVNDAELTPRLLSTYNINTLQVIVNDFRERIEQYNGELVQMLIEKDELQQEQEGVIFVFFKFHSQTFHFLPFFALTLWNELCHRC